MRSLGMGCPDWLVCFEVRVRRSWWEGARRYDTESRRWFTGRGSPSMWIVDARRRDVAMCRRWRPVPAARRPQPRQRHHPRHDRPRRSPHLTTPGLRWAPRGEAVYWSVTPVFIRRRGRHFQRSLPVSRTARWKRRKLARKGHHDDFGEEMKPKLNNYLPSSFDIGQKRQPPLDSLATLDVSSLAFVERN